MSRYDDGVDAGRNRTLDAFAYQRKRGWTHGAKGHPMTPPNLTSVSVVVRAQRHADMVALERHAYFIGYNEGLVELRRMAAAIEANRPGTPWAPPAVLS